MINTHQLSLVLNNPPQATTAERHDLHNTFRYEIACGVYQTTIYNIQTMAALFSGTGSLLYWIFRIRECIQSNNNIVYIKLDKPSTLQGCRESLCLLGKVLNYET